MKTVIVPYTLTTTQPTILTAPSGDPNSASSMKHIPGSSIRGAVARCIGTDDTARLESLVLSGKVTYLNAYPRVDGRRALPIPHSYRAEKDDEYRIHDLAGYIIADWPDIQLKKPQAHFVNATAPDKYTAEIGILSRIHHQRDRAMGRAWEKDGESRGTIFVYNYITKNQSFAGGFVVRAEASEIDSLISNLKGLLDHGLVLGRSRRAGYGANARITWQESILREISMTGDVGVLEESIGRGEKFRVMLLSDCIIRDSLTGQIDPSRIDSVILNLLEDKARLVQTFAFSRLVGGYNKKWKLEIPQSMAVGAGSLLVMEATDAIPLELMQSIEDEGIGERKIDGLGRVVFLDTPSEQTLLKDWEETKEYNRPDTEPPSAVVEMEQRIIRNELMRESELIARRIAADFVSEGKGRTTPSNSLIGRLRIPLQRKSSEALVRLKDWFDSTSKHSLRKPAMKQLGSSRIKVDDKPMTLLTWLDSVVKGKFDILAALSTERLCQDKHLISPESARKAVNANIEDINIRVIDTFLAEVVRLRKAVPGGGA